jgi:serine/threonine protein kinase
MAPEVFKHRKYDKKVDIFSFAMILYEVILPSKPATQQRVISYDCACSEWEWH